MSAVDRRAALAEAALTVASRDGVAAASTRAIVAEARMPLASFHYAVASHEELLRDVVGLVVAGERGATAASRALERDTLRDAVHAALTGYLDLVRSDPGREQAMFELTQHALRSDGLADLPARQYRDYRGLVADLLEAAAARYGIRWHRPVDELARFVVALTDGITLGWLADRDDTAAERMVGLATDALIARAGKVA